MRLAVLFLCLAASAVRAESLQLSDAWSRATMPGMSTAAVYLTMTNTGSDAVSVTGVQTPVAETAMLHETVMENQMMRMKHLHKLELAPGETVTFAPGGKHIMLTGVSSHLEQGQSLEVTFSYADGSTQTISAHIGGMGEMHGAH